MKNSKNSKNLLISIVLGAALLILISPLLYAAEHPGGGMSGSHEHPGAKVEQKGKGDYRRCCQEIDSRPRRHHVESPWRRLYDP